MLMRNAIKTMKLGALDFLEKPADLEKLTGIIKKAKRRKMNLGKNKAEK